MSEIVADGRPAAGPGHDHRMSDTITVYGIANCDTVKKARAWLDQHGIGYRFHDFKKQGLPLDRVDRWMAAAGWEALLNRQGTTWRKLDIGVRDAVVNAQAARRIMEQNPSVIKRPVVEWENGLTAGFDATRWERMRAPRL
jgi:arsenate reductase